MRLRLRGIGLCGARMVVSGLLVVAAAHASSGAGYTEEQAEAGRVAFERRCASCHLPDASGERQAPALIGPAFLDKWGDRPVRELFGRMRAGMPPYDVRPTADAYTSIIAHLLRANGLLAGTEPLDPTSYETLRPD